MSNKIKQNAKIISEAIEQTKKDPDGMALAFLNIFYDSKNKKEAPDFMIGALDQFERIAEENGIDINDLHITPVLPQKERRGK